MSLEIMKKRARRLQKAIQNMYGISVKLGSAYELIAQEDGFKNWDTAYASCKPRTPHTPEYGDDQLLLISSGSSEAFCVNSLMERNPRLEPILHRISAKNSKLVVVSGCNDSERLGLCTAILAESWKPDSTVEIPQSAKLSSGIANRQGAIFFENSDFERAISSALRSRPDRVFVGSIKTAHHLEQALELVLTGTTVIASKDTASEEPAKGWLLELASESRSGFENHFVFVDTVHLHLQAAELNKLAVLG